MYSTNKFYNSAHIEVAIVAPSTNLTYGLLHFKGILYFVKSTNSEPNVVPKMVLIKRI